MHEDRSDELLLITSIPLIFDFGFGVVSGMLYSAYAVKGRKQALASREPLMQQPAIQAGGVGDGSGTAHAAMAPDDDDYDAGVTHAPTIVVDALYDDHLHVDGKPQGRQGAGVEVHPLGQARVPVKSIPSAPELPPPS